MDHSPLPSAPVVRRQAARPLIGRGIAVLALTLGLGLAPVAVAQDATPEATPSAGRGTVLVTSTDPAPVIPDGTPSEVTVVAYGPLDAFTIPIIVVNGTDEAVENVEVSVAVDQPGEGAGTPAADGTPVAADGVPDESVAVEEDAPVAGRSLPILPDEIAPGGIAIGAITFDLGDVAADADVTFTVTSSPAGERGLDEVDLDLSDVAFDGTAFTGTATNLSGPDIPGRVGVRAVCQDGDGGLTGFVTGYLDADGLATGDSAPFELSLPPTVDGCDAWLVAASGRTF